MIRQIGNVIAEGFGTFMLLVLFFWLVGTFGPSYTAVAAWLALTAVVLLFVHISGANVNPAVTAMLAVAGRLRVSVALAYMFAQLLGAIGAVYAMPYITQGRFDRSATEQYVVVPPVDLGKWETMRQVFLFEAFGAAVLSLFVLCSTHPRAPIWVRYVAIGLGLGIAVALTAGVSGGSINPARALAPLIVAGIEPGNGWDFTIVAYAISGICGGAVIGLFGRLLNATPPPA